MIKTSRVVSAVCMYLFLIAMLAVMIVPFLWLIVSSLRPNRDLFSEPFAIPKSLSFENYRVVLAGHPMGQYLFNTLIITTLATAAVIIIAIMASYPFVYRSNYHSKPMSFISILLGIGLFIPTNAFLVPYYVFVNGLGLYNKVFGIALVYVGINLPQTFMVINGYMSTIPKDILESSRIDGASPFQALLRLMVPISVPGIVTAGIFVVVNCWNELLFANLLNQSSVSRTIQVAIRSFLTTFAANYAHAFAAMVISIVPTILIYVTLTDRIIDGMTVGAIKG